MFKSISEVYSIAKENPKAKILYFFPSNKEAKAKGFKLKEESPNVTITSFNSYSENIFKEHSIVIGLWNENRIVSNSHQTSILKKILKDLDKPFLDIYPSLLRSAITHSLEDEDLGDFAELYKLYRYYFDNWLQYSSIRYLS